MIAELHQMIYSEHLATMTALTGNEFADERSNARDQYRKAGQLKLPWLRWAPQKTITDLWNESRERRKDPTYMDNLRKLQQELDDRARKPIGRRYVRAKRKRPARR